MGNLGKPRRDPQLSDPALSPERRLSAARGIMLAIVLGAVAWGLFAGIVYLLRR
jgi:hypothetical protein